MPRLIILGTSNAVPDRTHENTHLVVVGKERTMLIDSGSNPTVRLQMGGLNPLSLTDLVATHFHPDHMSGIPSLLMNSWLTRRKEALTIYGLEETLWRLKKMMELYEWESWPNFFSVQFKRLPEEERYPVIDCPDFRVYSSPVCHMIPAIGLRIESPASGKVIAYSCDTEPCAQVIKLAAGADILIHEASGKGLGHSSAAQAGEIAQKAGVKALYLIHYPTGDFDPTPLEAEAGETFSGPVGLAHDLMEFEF